MADSRIEKLAQVLVRYSTSVRPNDQVLINGSSLADPLLKEIYSEVLKAGGNPLMMVSLPGTEELFYRHASAEQLKHVPRPQELIMETYDVRISVIAEANTRALSGVDPEKIVMRERARSALMRTFMRRSAAGELRWTVAPFPTNALAQDAEMSLDDYEDFVYYVCLPDMNNPVKYWQDFSIRQQRIVNWLKGRNGVYLKGPGTDLRFSISDRIFKSCDGHFNMPDGEIFTGPVEDSVEGQVYFSYPSIYEGKEVSGIRLWFEHGKVVKATAEKNQEFLIHTLDTDAGSRSVGEFGIGTNSMIDRFTREILFDEKIGGSFHLALGAGYPETGSRNQSAIHWDMICDLRNNGEIFIDDILLYHNGKLAIDA